MSARKKLKSNANLSNWSPLWRGGGRPAEGWSTTGDRGSKQERADGLLQRTDTQTGQHEGWKCVCERALMFSEDGGKSQHAVLFREYTVNVPEFENSRFLSNDIGWREVALGPPL